MSTIDHGPLAKLSAPGAGDTTLVTSTGPGDLSDLEAAIMDLCNELHAARASGVRTAESEAIRESLFDLLDEYDATDADNHPNPDWARPNQRALALSAAGDVNDAIEMELIALRHADTPRRREISLDNLADRCIRARRYEDAVAFFLEAQEVAPSSVPVLMTGAQALYLAGYHTEANSIFEAILDDASQLALTGPLGAYLDHEDRLRAMASTLPALAALYQAWSRVVALAKGGAA